MEIERLKSIKKLLEMMPNEPNVKLVSGNKNSYYHKGIIHLGEKHFSSWRVLATAYGHEQIHRINLSLHLVELHNAGYIGVNGKIPYYYDEALAHSWSTTYSQLGPKIPDFFITKSQQ